MLIMSIQTAIETALKNFTPNIAPAPFIADKGEGSYLIDTEGTRYLDFTSGIAVNNFGHCHPHIVKAVQDQTAKLMHTSNMFWNAPSMKLSERLIQLSFADRVYLCNSGTEANEAKIKIARKYFHDQGKPRAEFLCFFKSFHGRTMGSLSATGQEKYWKGFEPLVPGFKFAHFNDLKAVDMITEKTAGVWFEPIQGEGGVYPATQDFFQAIRKKCDETGSLLMLDEIQMGMGRTGTLFAYEHYGIKPDLLSLAKGLGGGLPIGAMLATEKVGSVLTVGSHATTFGGNPVCAAAANAALDILTEPAFLPNVKKKGEYFIAKLKERVGKHPQVQDIRGRGLMIGLEMKDDITKLFEQLRKNKILVTRIPPKILRIAPPLTVSEQEIDLFVSGLEKSLQEI